MRWDRLKMISGSLNLLKRRRGWRKIVTSLNNFSIEVFKNFRKFEKKKNVDNALSNIRPVAYVVVGRIRRIAADAVAIRPHNGNIFAKFSDSPATKDVLHPSRAYLERF